MPINIFIITLLHLCNYMTLSYLQSFDPGLYINYMLKMKQRYSIVLCLIALIASEYRGFSFSTIPQASYSAQSTQTSQCQYPLIIQSSFTLDVPSQDLDNLLTTNFTKPLKLPDIKNAEVSTTLWNISLSFRYPSSSNKTVQKISDKQINVINDSFYLQASMAANVTKRVVGVNVYDSVIAKSDLLFVNYTKQIVDYKFKLVNITIKYPQTQIFNSIVIKPTPEKATDKTKISTTINGPQLAQITGQQVDTIPDWLILNANYQSFSATYPSIIYEYLYSNWQTINMEMNSISVTEKDFNATTMFVNSIQATIVGEENVICPIKQKLISQPIVGLYFTSQFVQNFISYAIGHNSGIERSVDELRYISGYQNINISEVWITKNPSFQFRLIDLEFLSPKLVQKYSSQFLDKISFLCSAINADKILLDVIEQSIDVTILWNCSTYFTNNPSTSFLDFQTRNKHIVSLSLMQSAGNRVVKAENIGLDVQSVSYSAEGIDDIDEELGKIYIEQMFSNIQIQTVGTGFRVAKDSKQIVYEQSDSGIGIWIVSSRQLSKKWI